MDEPGISVQQPDTPAGSGKEEVPIGAWRRDNRCLARRLDLPWCVQCQPGPGMCMVIGVDKVRTPLLGIGPMIPVDRGACRGLAGGNRIRRSYQEGQELPGSVGAFDRQYRYLFKSVADSQNAGRPSFPAIIVEPDGRT